MFNCSAPHFWCKLGNNQSTPSSLEGDTSLCVWQVLAWYLASSLQKVAQAGRLGRLAPLSGQWNSISARMPQGTARVTQAVATSKIQHRSTQSLVTTCLLSSAILRVGVSGDAHHGDPKMGKVKRFFIKTQNRHMSLKITGPGKGSVHASNSRGERLANLRLT